MINEDLRDSIFQYSADGLKYWEPIYIPEVHYNNEYPGVELGPHRYMRIMRTNSTGYDGPMRIVPIDAYNMMLVLIDNVVYWKYTNEDDSKYRELFKPSEFAIKGDRGERGASLQIDAYDYFDNIGLYTPSLSEINTVVSSCHPCNQGANDVYYRQGTKIFMSMGKNETDDTGAGEIYGYSYNKKTWIKLPGIISPTGEVRMSLSGPLRYLGELIDLDVFAVDGEFLTLKEQGVNIEHLSDAILGYGLQKVLEQGNAKYAVNLNDFIGFGIELYTEDLGGGSLGNIRFRINPNSFIEAGFGLKVINSTSNELNRKYTIIINAPDILLPLAGIEVIEGTNGFNKIRLRLDSELYIDNVTGKLKINTNNTSIVIKDSKVAIKETDDDAQGANGVTKLHTHKNIADETKGFAKDLTSKQFYIKVNAEELMFDSSGNIIIKNNAIKFAHIKDDVFDSTRGIGADSKYFVKTTNHFEFTEGSLSLNTEVLKTIIGTMSVSKIRTIDNPEGIQGSVLFTGSETSDIITEVVRLNDSIIIKANITTLYEQSLINSVIEQLNTIDLAQNSESLNSLRNFVNQINANKANKNHQHSLNDITGNETLFKAGVVYGHNIAFNTNGIWVKMDGDINFARIGITSAGELYVDASTLMKESNDGILVNI